MFLKGKVVLVIGGGRGIGRDIAIACAREGARMVVAARSENELKETTALMESETKQPAYGVRCDVSRLEDPVKLVSWVEDKVGPIYGLICAAGVYGAIGNFEETPIEEWEKAIAINLVGTARCLHAVIPAMKRRREGRVILFSGGGQGPFPRFSAYASSKGGVWRLTDSVAAELSPYGIFVNAIAPGAVNTKLLDELLAAGPERVGKDFYEKSLKQKREGGASPEKAIRLVKYLLSHKSEGLYGKTLSALWDDYENLTGLAAVSKSDLFGYRRVVKADGGTR